MGAGNHSLLIYVICFFIYLNIKIALFLGFYEYVKKMLSRFRNNSEEASNPEEEALAEVELRQWYERSVFKKVSKLEYNSEMGRLMSSFRKFSGNKKKSKNNKREAEIILEKPHYNNTINPNDLFSDIT